MSRDGPRLERRSEQHQELVREVAQEAGDTADNKDDRQPDAGGYLDETIYQDCDCGHDKPDQDGKRRATQELEVHITDDAPGELVGST